MKAAGPLWPEVKTPGRALQKENATLKTPAGEITLANDALKKRWRQTAVQDLILQDMSPNKALCWCGVTRRRQHHVPRAREPVANPDMIRQIREERPPYGTRRTVAELSRRPGMQNCKMVRHTHKRTGRMNPLPGNAKARRKPIRPAQPGLEEPTSGAVPCNGWRYYFNVLDIFTRQYSTGSIRRGESSQDMAFRCDYSRHHSPPKIPGQAANPIRQTKSA